MKNLFRALSYFRPDATRLFFVVLLMLASIALNVLKPWPLAIIVDSILGDKPFPLIPHLTAENKIQWLPVLALAIFILHLAQGGLSAAQNFISIKIGLRGLTRVRNDVFAKLQRLSLSFLQGAKSGDLIYRASWDTYAFQTLFQQGLITFATAFFSLLLMIFVMAKMNARLTLAALALVPFLVLAIKFFGKRMSARATTAQQTDSAVTSLVQQSIASMQLIQSYTREEFEKKRFGAQVVAAEKRRVAQHGLEIFYWLAIAVLFGAGTAWMTWLGAKEVLAGRLSVGELLIFVAYLAQLYEPLNQLSQVGATISGAAAGTRRVFEILDTGLEVKQPEHAIEKKISGRIDFQNVSFSYEKSRDVLRHLTLTLEPGTCAAIIGPSGSGKTTLLNLVPRFFDPASGVVKIDGIDLREFDLKNLRSQIALVLQQPIIFPGTIAENISCAKPGATFDEIQKAAELANANVFIERLPKKFETQIGEGAARLSIGEQQRINLARAFLKSAPILLLDEPTSALDAESEALVMSGVQRLVAGRTTLIVAHRRAMLERADKILVVENGEILESGTLAELARRDGYFSRIMRDRQTNVL
jgi:ATP-binding cassette subfamily B protein/subfamily B ATP-binding cassette protein MsbA